MIKKLPVQGVLKAFTAGVLLNILFSCILTFTLSFLPDSNPYLSSYTESVDLITNFSIAFLIVKTGFLIPIIEEFIFRFLIFNFFLKRCSFRIALIIQALLFASIHLSLIQFVYTFILGLVFGLCYRKSDSNLLIPILIHIGINLSSVLFMILF